MVQLDAASGAHDASRGTEGAAPVGHRRQPDRVFAPGRDQAGRGQLDVEPLIFVYTVIFAANCSFVTPISYQTNLLVMGPGKYEFRDYMRVGTPLLIVIWITFTFFAPWYFGISW